MGDSAATWVVVVEEVVEVVEEVVKEVVEREENR